MGELKKIQNDECKNRICANINCDIEGEVWDPETHKCICDSKKHMVIVDGACICKPETFLQWDNNLEGYLKYFCEFQKFIPTLSGLESLDFATLIILTWLV